MEVLIGLLVSITLLITSVVNQIYIGYALNLCLLLFIFISLKKGYNPKDILKMSVEGAKQSFIVIRILLIMGVLISLWMAAGTIPTIVYYCLQYVMANTFVLFAFLLCCITSFLIGTAFGTVSTIGIPLFILAKSGGVDLNIIAGAIIAGAYFGDRCSPMSASATLVANLTKTNVFHNMKEMFYSAAIPFVLSIGFYYILSMSEPLKVHNETLSIAISNTFQVNWLMVLPIICILILSIFKVRIELSMLGSILIAVVLSTFVQHYPVGELLKTVIFGFHLEQGILKNIIVGGGLLSMAKTSYVIFVSFALGGIFKGIHMFDRLKKFIFEMRLSRRRLFGMTSIVSAATAAFGCTQSISTVMTNEIMSDCYVEKDNRELAIDLENSGILIAPLIPWNIAAFMPTSTLHVSPTGFIPYAFYLYMVPIMYFLMMWMTSENGILKNSQRFPFLTKQLARVKITKM